MKSVLNIHWKDWCWSWNSNTLATLCEEVTHLKTVMLGKIEGAYRGGNGWMASPTQLAWVWVSFGSWWWTGKPDVLQSMGSQRVRHNWVTELNTCFHRECFCRRKSEEWCITQCCQLSSWNPVVCRTHPPTNVPVCPDSFQLVTFRLFHYCLIGKTVCVFVWNAFV